MLKELDDLTKDFVCCDETGRGNAAGSLYVCGVKLKNGVSITDISFADDSKKVSKKNRELMSEKLIKLVDYEIVEIYPKFIDENGISSAMNHCLSFIKNSFNVKELIFDGNTSYKVDGVKTYIKGDQRSSLIAAASIIAKVRKDADMLIESEKYPEYDFDKNSGYLTKHHTEMIKKFGYTPIHRRSFNIKALVGLNIKNK